LTLGALAGTLRSRPQLLGEAERIEHIALLATTFVDPGNDQRVVL
jgi:hypothetical protein